MMRPLPPRARVGLPVGSPDAGALVVPPGVATPGRARGLPLRREGAAKLTGAARYADDRAFPGAWYGTTIRSTDAHARLVAIEPDPAADWSGVVLVTAADIPGERTMSSTANDQPVLVPVGGTIRHHAEPVALLAAPDRATLAALRDRVRLVTEPLPPVFDPEASDHDFATFDLEEGDLRIGFAESHLVLEGEYRTGHQEQLYIENNGMIAVPGPDGAMTLHGSMQCLYYVHPAVARALAIPPSNVRVVQAETGGGFGGKEDYPSILAVHAALLARRAGRPVRMIYDRHEDIVATTKRHPSIVRHRTGVARDGRLLAMEIEVVLDGGAYATLSPFVLSRATLHAAGPYHCPAVRIVSAARRTNTPPNGAFRGFGGPQVGFAVETHLNRIAERLGMSPAELRARNVYRPGQATPTGQVLRESVAMEACLRRAVEASDFEAAREATARQALVRRGSGSVPASRLRSGNVRTARGVGLALGWHGAGFTGKGEDAFASTASVELDAAGVVRVLVGTTEMGQGTATILPLLVADELDLPADAVEFAPQDTAVVPDTGPTVASRTAMVVGALVIGAARKLRSLVAERYPGRSFAEVAVEHARRYGAVRCDQVFEPFADLEFDEATLRGDAHSAFGWGACVADVEVDLDTGEVAVHDVVAVDDIGRVIHPILAEGQIEGGTLQAVGYATIEEMKLQDGRYRNDRLATYLIPTAQDAPRIRAMFVEAPYPGLPHGAKGAGELPMNIAAPAVVAAIHDAVGAWVTELPATPERILDAMLDRMPAAAGPETDDPEPAP
jgi:CO/xanthine dehydrogenase Mo-binding subunit